MSMRLKDKVCLVMGGGSLDIGGLPGNGQATAIVYAREGASVVVVDINLASAERTVSQIREAGGDAIAVEANVTKSADVKSVVKQTLASYGRLDVLHNNVGTEYRGEIEDTPEAEWDRIHDINLKSVFLACQAVLPQMLKQGGGAIVNVSSTASLYYSGVPYLSYNTSKAAVNHMTRILAARYAPNNIRFNVVVPGMIDTAHVRHLHKEKSEADFAQVVADRNAKCPMGRQGTSWDIANAALFLASDEASYVTGNLLVVDGALTI